jgi:hypothetical protein
MIGGSGLRLVVHAAVIGVAAGCAIIRRRILAAVGRRVTLIVIALVEPLVKAGIVAAEIGGVVLRRIGRLIFPGHMSAAVGTECRIILHCGVTDRTVLHRDSLSFLLILV